MKRSSSSDPNPALKKVKSKSSTGPDESANKVFEEVSKSKLEKKSTSGFKSSGKNVGKKTKINKKLELLKKKGKKSFPEIPNKLLDKDGKPKWNEYKEEMKKLKEKRKTQKSGMDQYQLTVKAKSIWEKLRNKGKKELSKEEKEGLVNELFMLLKKEIPNVVHSHDISRVVQWMLKLGSASIRTSICEALSTDTVKYLQSKFASFCVLRALQYGSKTDKSHLIQSCQGHFFKLLNQLYASHVVDEMYSTHATSQQRKQIQRELYGEMHVLLPPEIASIKDIPQDIQPSVLGATKVNLSKLLDKKHLLKSTLVLSVLSDFLYNCSSEDCNDIVEILHSDILEFLDTKEGSKVALQVVWRATNKMKKTIVKLLKGKVKEIATSESGHSVLLALFDCVDDTVLIRKALIPELLNEPLELAQNEWGRRVILYLVAHRDKQFFHPQLIEIFAKGDTISNRKKDTSTREQEILEAVSGPLLKKIAGDPQNWLGYNSVAMVSLAIIKSGKGRPLQEVFESIVTYMLNPDNTLEVNSMQCHVVEHTAVHMVCKKLIQLDQERPDETELFSLILASQLSDKSLNHILKFNRGCFLLVLLLETKNHKVCELIKLKMNKKMKSFLQEQETTGSKILLKKLKEDE